MKRCISVFRPLLAPREALNTSVRRCSNGALSIVDAHHHFYDPTQNSFHAFLGRLGAGPYLPESYAAEAQQLDIQRTVHVECIADDGEAEVKWVDGLVAAGRCRVGAIVGSCNLAGESADKELAALVNASPLARGVRWILDYEGPPFDGTNATHIACSRHGRDYLRDPDAAAKFERGFALLKQHGLSFDLQASRQ